MNATTFKEYLKLAESAFRPLSEQEKNIARSFWDAGTTATQNKYQEWLEKVRRIAVQMPT